MIVYNYFRTMLIIEYNCMALISNTQAPKLPGQQTALLPPSTFISIQASTPLVRMQQNCRNQCDTTENGSQCRLFLQKLIFRISDFLSQNRDSYPAKSILCITFFGTVQTARHHHHICCFPSRGSPPWLTEC